MSRRSEFVKRKNLASNLKKYNAFGVNGYYPLFSTAKDAEAVSIVSTYHTHEFEGVEYYMPDGLEMNKTQFHGDWETPNEDETTIVAETTQPEVARIIPPPIVIPDLEPEQEPTYVPPPRTTTRSSGGGSSGGY